MEIVRYGTRVVHILVQKDEGTSTKTSEKGRKNNKTRMKK